MLNMNMGAVSYMCKWAPKRMMAISVLSLGYESSIKASNATWELKDYPCLSPSTYTLKELDLFWRGAESLYYFLDDFPCWL